VVCQTGSGEQRIYQTVGAFERTIIEQVMKQTSGNKTRAAELLQLRRTTFSAKLRTLGAAA
jgi:DNA-binding protein Fis